MTTTYLCFKAVYYNYLKIVLLTHKIKSIVCDVITIQEIVTADIKHIDMLVVITKSFTIVAKVNSHMKGTRVQYE